MFEELSFIFVLLNSCLGAELEAYELLEPNKLDAFEPELGDVEDFTTVETGRGDFDGPLALDFTAESTEDLELLDGRADDELDD